MQKYLIGILLMAAISAPLHAQNPKARAIEAQLFSNCLVQGDCWLGRQHPNIFEHGRFSASLQRFLTPKQYKALVQAAPEHIILQLWNTEKSIDIVAGFCPEPNDEAYYISPWNRCARVVVISFTWDTALSKIFERHPKRPMDQVFFNQLSQDILGVEGKGGKLQILSLAATSISTKDGLVFKPDTYWQDGLKQPLNYAASTTPAVWNICQQITSPQLGPRACMQALEKAFSKSLR